jgi:hypothetical protein
MVIPTSREEAIAAENTAFNLFLTAQDALDREYDSTTSGVLQNALAVYQTRGREWRETVRVTDHIDEIAAAEEAAGGNAGARAEFTVQRRLRRNLQRQHAADRLEQSRLRSVRVMIHANGHPEVETSITDDIDSTSGSISTMRLSQESSPMDEGSDASYANGVSSMPGDEAAHTPDTVSVAGIESNGTVNDSRLSTAHSEALIEVPQWFSDSEGSVNSYAASILEGEGDVAVDGESMPDA